jgi:hypothetical protein
MEQSSFLCEYQSRGPPRKTLASEKDTTREDRRKKGQKQRRAADSLRQYARARVHRGTVSISLPTIQVVADQVQIQGRKYRV